MLGCFRFIPPFLRDAVYKLIAKNRHAVSKKLNNACRLPAPALAYASSIHESTFFQLLYWLTSFLFNPFFTEGFNKRNLSCRSCARWCEHHIS
ncbi:hypothetical protein [Rubritalea sp.]|uniref:hypothetical protein n=1 Tax=Rubritalea sp. TaxID=2109375 RepID=UPI003EF62FB6